MQIVLWNGESMRRYWRGRNEEEVDQNAGAFDGMICKLATTNHLVCWTSNPEFTFYKSLCM